MVDPLYSEPMCLLTWCSVPAHRHLSRFMIDAIFKPNEVTSSTNCNKIGNGGGSGHVSTRCVLVALHWEMPSYPDSGPEVY